MNGVELLTVGDQLLEKLRVPLDAAELRELLDRRESLIARLESPPPGVAELLRHQDDRIQTAMASLLEAVRRQMHYCSPATVNVLVDACR